jgi:hypothetical protein
MSAVIAEDIKWATERAEEMKVFDYYRGVDPELKKRDRILGLSAEHLFHRLLGWKLLRLNYHTPDLQSPYGSVDVKARTWYREEIEVTSNPDLVILVYYYHDYSGSPFVSWVNTYTREDLKFHLFNINVSRGRWAMWSRKHIPIHPSLFSTLPAGR